MVENSPATYFRPKLFAPSPTLRAHTIPAFRFVKIHPTKITYFLPPLVRAAAAVWLFLNLSPMQPPRQVRQRGSGGLEPQLFLLRRLHGHRRCRRRRRHGRVHLQGGPGGLRRVGIIAINRGGPRQGPLDGSRRLRRRHHPDVGRWG